MVRDLGWAVLAIYREAPGVFCEESADEHDGQAVRSDGREVGSARGGSGEVSGRVEVREEGKHRGHRERGGRGEKGREGKGRSGEAEENGVGVIVKKRGERKKKTRRVLARRVWGSDSEFGILS